MTIVTSEFRANAVRRFLDDVISNDYYMFASSTSPVSVINSEVLKRNFLEKTIFGKKIDTDEVLYMIRNYRWQTGEVYRQYDDTKLLCGSNFYTVVFPENNETGDYRIYKCLFNSYDSKSINPPNFNENTPNQIYVMPDGYIWKFMYSLSVVEFQKYSAQGFIPVPKEISDSNTATSNTIIDDSETFSNRTIDQIFVENPDDNIGYVIANGSIAEVNRTNGIIIIEAVDHPFNQIENFYVGYTFYVTSSFGSKVYEIASYFYDQLTGRARITLTEGAPIDDILESLSTFTITPRVEVFGDGDGVIAIPTVSDRGSITKITVLNNGGGYSNATASIRDPFGFNPMQTSLYKRVILRPVLSPRGGHRSDIVSELSCRHILVYSDLTIADNNVVPINNSIAILGIVKNPRFKKNTSPDDFDNRIELALKSHGLIPGDGVLQIETENQNSKFFNRIRFSAEVHSTSGDIVYLTNYNGPFPRDVDDTEIIYDGNDFSDLSLRLDLPLLSSSGDVLDINTDNDPAYPEGFDLSYPGFSISPYVQRTGKVQYMNAFPPITRTEDSREQFKIILEF
jgi:hypothetical protein